MIELCVLKIPKSILIIAIKFFNFTFWLYILPVKNEARERERERERERCVFQPFTNLA